MGRRPAPSTRRGLLAALTLLVVAACHFQADAARVVGPQMDWGLGKLDLRDVNVTEQGVILPNGTKLKVDVDDDGMIDINGEKLTPFDGLPVERELSADHFTCHHGRLFGIRLPDKKPKGKRKRREQSSGKFYYVKQADRPQWGGLELYNDLSDDLRHFLVFPGDPALGWRWRMLSRRCRARRGACGFHDQRLFDIGDQHPCDADLPPEDDEEEPEAEEVKTQGAKAVSNHTTNEEEQPVDGDQKGEADVVGGDDPWDDGEDDLFVARGKPGPLAEDVLRDLVSLSWKPMEPPWASRC